MSAPLKIGIAGLGTVGGGTLRILREQSEMLAARCGRKLEVVVICARDRKKARSIDVSNIRWCDNPLSLAFDPEIDVVVELIGGAEGIARELAEKSLQAGKSVVTANKALIAQHGVALAKLAEKSGVLLAFEAAVAGGIPIIKALRDGLPANQFTRVAGILNGTCNYILTSMQSKKCGFDVALKEAQRLGYAESDPSFDVDGVDTAHKLAILASLAFGCPPDIKNMYIEGIRSVGLRDMEFAHELGYAIKLLGIATKTSRGVERRVHPCLVGIDSPLGMTQDVFNAILVEGEPVGSVFFEGLGAGAGPTASSVIADIMDIARGTEYKPFTLPASELTEPALGMEGLACSYYLRLSVADRPGVLAEVTGLFKNEGISLRSFLQRPHTAGETAELVVTTHETEEKSMQAALKAIEKLSIVKERPYMIRIEEK